MNWETERNRQARSTKQAEDLVANLGLANPPIDPLIIAAGESPLLVTKGGHLGDLFDGQLEYHAAKNRFVLFYNTKYDSDSDRHHPRTRFSIGHELGHFYLEKHRAYLMQGGESHRSRSELFTDDMNLEREADAFAAGLLLPRQLVIPRVRGRELTMRVLDNVVDEFETSRAATAWRCVELSDQPCAVFAIRNGQIAWRKVSEAVIRAKCYPRKDRRIRSDGAQEEWQYFMKNSGRKIEKDTHLHSWFETYDRGDLDGILVTEQYIPIPVMKTLIVLITMDEDDLLCD